MQKSKLLSGDSDSEYIFKEVDGMYIDITNQLSGSFADFLSENHIILDDDASFCRIIRFVGKFKYTYVIRCYGSKITVNIHIRKIY